MQFCIENKVGGQLMKTVKNVIFSDETHIVISKDKKCFLSGERMMRNFYFSVNYRT